VKVRLLMFLLKKWIQKLKKKKEKKIKKLINKN